MSGNDKEKKPWVGTMPGILTGSAALLAALTTVYVNVRDDVRGKPTPVAQAAPQAPAAHAAPAPLAGPQKLQLTLQRVAVQHDGEMGTADWRFAVEADGQPLFAFEQDALNDEGGRNVVVADDLKKARASLELAQGQRIPLTVKAWRSGWFTSSAEPVATGEGVLTAKGALAPIAVKAVDEKKGAFTFYFSATPDRD
ncbi:MAG TPA: hypothetical protein VFF96_12060 [Pseudoxanthomonas sp.]|nr:hypothetical protein [Pseudoxanthomonas sp.]